MKLYGADYGQKKTCRVCQYDLFLVEMGTGTVNGDTVSVLTLRCYRCGTIMDQLQVDWKSSVTQKDKVVVEDGIKR